jgi:hypothetical protein
VLVIQTYFEPADGSLKNVGINEKASGMHGMEYSQILGKMTKIQERNLMPRRFACTKALQLESNLLKRGPLRTLYR